MLIEFTEGFVFSHYPWINCSMPDHSYVAAYDLDKTIIAVNSSRFMVTESRKIGLMSTREFLRAIYFSILYKFDLQNHQKIVISMIRWLKGRKEEEVRTMIQEQGIPYLIQNIRPEIIRSMREHREKNARIVMLSSAMPYLCNPIARHLGIDDVVCSRLEIVDGEFTGKPVGNLVFDREKEVRMRAYCEQHGFDLADAWYYGDAFTDRFVLKSVGNPVVVQPEIKLGWMARRNGWRFLK